MKWRKAKAKSFTKRTCCHSKHPFPRTQEMTLRWTLPNGQYQNQTDYVLCSQRCRSSIQSAKTRTGANNDSDHELLIAKFRVNLKKVAKTTKQFRCDFPDGSDSKASAYNAGDLGSIPGSGRSPGEGNGNPLQYSCLEKSHGGRGLVGYSPWGRKESDTIERLHFHFSLKSNPLQLHSGGD